jgi:hypothetical protein
LYHNQTRLNNFQLTYFILKYISYGSTGTRIPHPTAISMEPPARPPETEMFSTFGTLRRLIEQSPTLEESDPGFKTLFDPTKPADVELKILLEKLKTFYQETKTHLLFGDINTLDPKKMGQELKLIYVNLLYLINEQRQFQAREDMIKLLQQQLEMKRNVIESLQQVTKSAAKELEMLSQSSSTTNIIITSNTTSTHNDDDDDLPAAKRVRVIDNNTSNGNTR